VTRAAVALVLAGLVAAGPATAHDGAALPPLDFEPPAAGTYTLHRILTAPDGEVLDLEGRPRRLHDLTRGRITLLGLVYTTCVDPDGCPLALRVFDDVRRTVTAEPRLHGKVQLVTLSFDPVRDRPAAMRAYAGTRAATHAVPWHFLTTRSPAALAPLVSGFGQDVRSASGGADGRAGRALSHVLKVFLIDPTGGVREIYTSTFLHPRTVLNDIDTLLLDP
jgi:protein SCO1